MKMKENKEILNHIRPPMTEFVSKATQPNLTS